MNYFEWRDAPTAELAVIGDPINQSLSPEMQTAALKEMGLDWKFVRIRVPEGEGIPAVEHLIEMGYKGVNVTTPLKQEVLGLPFTFDECALEASACNVLSFTERKGTNTDGSGFLRVLENAGVSQSSSILLLGAGGAARALAFALAKSDYNFAVWNRTPSRAEALVSAVGGSSRVSSNLRVSSFDVVVNATSSQFSGERLPIDWADGSGIAIDLVYNKESLFLKDAELAGWQTLDGRELLVGQGLLAFEFWFGKEASVGAMRKALGLS